VSCVQKFKQLLKSLLLIPIFSKAPSNSLIKFRVNRFLGYNLLLNHSAYQFSPLINEGRRRGIKAINCRTISRTNKRTKQSTQQVITPSYPSTEGRFRVSLLLKTYSSPPQQG